MSAWQRLVPRGPGARLVAFAGTLILCGIAQWYIRHGQHWTGASILLVVAAVAAAIVLGKSDAEPVQRADPLTERRSSVRLALGVALIVAGVGGLGYASYLLSTDWLTRFDIGAPLALAGVAVWSAGLALVQGRRGATPLPILRWEGVALVGILALGTFLRFWHYDTFPPQGVCAVEEPQSGMAAHYILHDGARPWEFVGDRWLPVPFFAVMGQTLTALRLPFTIVSVLTIFPFYLLTRHLVARPAALFAAALFAVCSWLLFYARLAHAIFPTTLIVVLLLYLSVRVHRRGGLGPYPWIGFLSAYTLYAYAGYRATSGLVALFLLVSLGGHVLEWRRQMVPRFRNAARRVVITQCVGFLCAAAAYAALVAPLAMLLKNNPTYYLEAAQRATLDSQYYTTNLRSAIDQRIARLRETAAMFNHVGDGAFTFNLPGEPMLDPVTGVLFPIGLAYTLVWWRHRMAGFYAGAFLFVLIMGTTFVHNFDIRRLQGMIPFMFVMIAFAADRVLQLSARWRPRQTGRLVAATGVLVAAAALAFNYDLYFRRTMNDPKVIAGFHNRYTLDIAYLHGLPPTAYLLVVGDTLNLFSPNDFEWWRGHDVPGSASADLLPIFRGLHGAWSGRDLRILIEQPFEREALAALLQERFPGTRCEELTLPKAPHLDYTVCHVPPFTVLPPFTGGVRARYFRHDAAAPFLDRVEPAISFAFTPEQCMEPAVFEAGLCRVEWEGIWSVPSTGPYHLKAEGRSADVVVTVDGQPVVGGKVTLDAGSHVVRVESRYRSQRETGTRLLWRLNEKQPWRLLPLTPGDAAKASTPALAAPSAPEIPPS
jgi:dolichyl-phosphate-mannose-protein mannosyltransferase